MRSELIHRGDDACDCIVYIFCILYMLNIDSCQGRVIQQKIVSNTPPTAVVKLLQYSGLGSNTGMGFHPTNDSHECLKW